MLIENAVTHIGVIVEERTTVAVLYTAPESETAGILILRVFFFGFPSAPVKPASKHW